MNKKSLIGHKINKSLIKTTFDNDCATDEDTKKENTKLCLKNLEACINRFVRENKHNKNIKNTEIVSNGA